MTSKWWANEESWRKAAIWVTAFMLVVLIVLTFDTIPKISVGSERVPAYSVINQRIDYVFNEQRNFQVPVIGTEQPLFGTILNEDEAEALVTWGKKITQGRNCMNCHTLLGNGAYYAPDLTKSWLDPNWGDSSMREAMMIRFLMDPPNNYMNDSGRKMPNMHISEDEAKAVIAFLKWMSSIDTNGFPYNFKPIDQEG
ncbi:MAG: cytochrome C [Zetaproteobacteria bacterium CG12_big_fil_rev_8_21_14_0_65_55_1124]|nr:MAG: cytochrome C [Zetaproteobacteria bacterium CG1_02_55_237]PIS18786.1 MAG: cytochrome C [Zetaproteobacteria bacterium CG08_land_8_20_14_0_20_55_17]PIW43902.1 MAG: cytochrome C [Zetaproteobacteria bacterium CG12_big_fil_rev_8_21_14_0_65_55_1124]PIY54467.1 MAG: cytochrome C [Zetaproteobacteria bacterium CG_4_10_14_0_8_um_filter_55_43]PIZ38221.1 MAG: cytochrome C [Zetaproteobacteria bacterium CG_4_10_14_0_2_um_filter_55_20]PJB82373.1 MAG: cytochrome C [Zetaproteobacteria bacterium CG_4_9_14